MYVTVAYLSCFIPSRAVSSLVSPSLSVVIHLTLVAEWKPSWRLPVVLGKATQGNKTLCFHDEVLSR